MDILIVEDNELTHKALMKLVRRMGLDPRGAKSCKEAMEAVEAQSPQVLLTDWDLGDHCSGVDVAEHAIRFNQACKIIFCTGNCINTLKREAAHLPGSRFIRKPMSLQLIRETLNEVLTTH